MKVKGKNIIVNYNGKLYEINGVIDLEEGIANVFIEKGWVEKYIPRRGRKKKRSD